MKSRNSVPSVTKLTGVVHIYTSRTALINVQLFEIQFSLRDLYCLICARNISHLSSFSLQPTRVPFMTEMDQAYIVILFYNIPFNIIFPSKLRSSKQPLSFSLSNQTPLLIHLLFHASHISRLFILVVLMTLILRSKNHKTSHFVFT